MSPSQEEDYNKSRKLNHGHDLQQQEKGEIDPREKWVTIIPLTGFAIGLLAAAGLVVQGLLSIEHHKYSLILDEQWKSFNTDIWTKESNIGGFG